MVVHLDLRQCLENLYQQKSEGGQEESFETETEHLGRRPRRPKGDCAIVSQVHATFRGRRERPNGKQKENSQWRLSGATTRAC